MITVVIGIHLVVTTAASGSQEIENRTIATVEKIAENVDHTNPLRLHQLPQSTMIVTNTKTTDLGQQNENVMMINVHVVQLLLIEPGHVHRHQIILENRAFVSTTILSPLQIPIVLLIIPIITNHHHHHPVVTTTNVKVFTSTIPIL